MRKRNIVAASIAAALFSTIAWAFPWDIDMVDSAFYRAYEWQMLTPAEGAVSINRYREGCEPTCRAPTQLAPEFDRNNPAGQARTSPLDASDPTVLANGERLFGVYCQTCHGVNGAGGAPVADNTTGKRFPGVPLLSGPTATTSYRSDGFIYLYVRHGGVNMPSYSYAMSDEDIWSVVAYVRTLPNAARPAPAVPATPATPGQP